MQECYVCRVIKGGKDYYTKANGYVDHICKDCRKKQAHELYLQHKKDLLGNGHSKILHRKPLLLRKVCVDCDIEKDKEEFPYDASRDCYGNICKVCSYARAKQKSPPKESKFGEKRKLLAEGKQICRYCKQTKPIEEMIVGQGTYTGACKVCNLKQRHLKYGTPHKAKERKEKGQIKRQRKQEWKDALQQKRDLFNEGFRVCTKCKQRLPMDKFAAKHLPPKTLRDYRAVCRKCTDILYAKPSTSKRRIQKNMQAIVDFINTDFTCELCGKTKAPYEMGVVNKRLCWCKECQVVQKRKQHNRKNRNKANTSYKRLVIHMRRCLKDSLIGRKGHKTFIYLGCTGLDLQMWLESQFTEGMSWENRGMGGWHIDHYVPISYFDMSKEEDRFICWNYRNLRPLWGAENVEKGDSLPDDYLQCIENIRQSLINSEVFRLKGFTSRDNCSIVV